MKLLASDFIVRREGYASSPWRIIHAPTGKQVTIPKELTNADGKTVRYRGPAAFSRKRDALAWLRDELPKLLDAA